MTAGSMLGGRYEILEVQEGGQCRVFKARDRMGRLVAIKTPNERTRAAPRLLQRFSDEAQLLATFNEPHIVQVLNYHEAGELDENCYLVLEWLDRNLREIIDSEPLSPTAVRRILGQIVQGLCAIHAKGRIHGDLKPENILLSADGRQLKLTDLGGNQGTLAGSAQYQAPEAGQFGGTLDGRADLYALGMLAVEMLVGGVGMRRLFPEMAPGDPPERLRERWTNWHRDPACRLPRLDTEDPAIPVDLAILVENLLEKDPARRPLSADGVLEALKAAPPPRADSPVVEAGPSLASEAGQDVKAVTHWWDPFWVKATLMVVLILAGFGGYVAWAMRGKQPDNPDQARLYALVEQVKQARSEAVEAGAREGVDVHMIAGDAAREDARAALAARRDPELEAAAGRALAEYRQALASARAQPAPAPAPPPPPPPEAATPPAVKGPEGSAEFAFEAGATAADQAAAAALGAPSPTDACAPETPRQVRLRPFCLQSREINRADYAAFLAARKPKGWQSQAERTGGWLVVPAPARSALHHWRQPHGAEAPGPDTDPLVFVTQAEAAEFCAAQGARLPTEDEWEFAARGPERRLFPWGNEWRPAAVLGGAADARFGDASALGDGATPDGLSGLAGGVREWTATAIGSGPVKVVVKGGSFRSEQPAAMRPVARACELPTRPVEDIGFRCARDLPAWTSSRACAATAPEVTPANAPGSSLMAPEGGPAGTAESRP